MPKGYMLVEVTVHDPAAYEVYRRQVMATVEAYGGRFLVRGGPAELVEGSGAPGRVVVLEFPSPDAARSWYASPGYQAILPHRLDNSTGRMICVEGV